VLLRPFEVVKRRAQERPGSPFERRGDFFVVIEAGRVFHRDDGVGAVLAWLTVPLPAS
jgi:hypothetical protein